MKTEAVGISREDIKRILQDSELAHIVNNAVLTYSDKGKFHTGNETPVMGDNIEALVNPDDYDFTFYIHRTKRNHEDFIFCNMAAINLKDLEIAENRKYTVKTYLWRFSEGEAIQLGLLENPVKGFQRSTEEDLLNSSKNDLISYINQLELGISNIANYVTGNDKVTKAEIIKLLNNLV